MEIDVRLGFACKITDGPNIRTLILRRLTPENIRVLVRENLLALRGQFLYLAEHGIEVFRICSDAVPFGSSPCMPIDWKSEFREEFASLGAYAKSLNLRLSMHPGQYTVLNSPDAHVVSEAVSDLEYHSAVLDLMGMGRECKLVLHIGGVYGDKAAALKSFEKNFDMLSDSVKSRLILENDHNRFTAEDALFLSERLGIPMVFDYHHYTLFPGELTVPDILDRAGATWKKSDGRMKIHYSQSGADKRCGAHSETIGREEFLEFLPNLSGYPCDLMLEVKDKNVSADNCRRWIEEFRRSEHSKRSAERTF